MNTIATTPTRSNLLMAIRLNSDHGQQLSQEDKRRRCIALYSAGYVLKTIKTELSVSYSFVQNATKNVRDEEEKQRDRKIAAMYMACKTNEEIASEMHVDPSTANRKIATFVQIIENDNLHKSRAFFTDNEFTLEPYKIATTPARSEPPVVWYKIKPLHCHHTRTERTKPITQVMGFK